jgi:hypothetical protein
MILLAYTESIILSACASVCAESIILTACAESMILSAHAEIISHTLRLSYSQHHLFNHNPLQKS